MNNEPVAWMDKRTSKCVVFINTPPSDDWIPLYTHPYKPSKSEVDALLDNADYVIGTMREELEKLKTKTLTDEEIEKVRVAIMNTAYWCADENMSEAYNAVKVCCSEVLAILRKAQEK